MSKQLSDLRADIEHKFTQPPSPERCAELAEYVWYFLRSTDPFVRVMKSGFTFNADGVGYEGDYEITFYHPEEPEKNSNFTAQIAKEHLSSEPKDDWLEIEILNITTEAEMREKQKALYLQAKGTPSGLELRLKSAPNVTDVHVNGVILGPVEKLITLHQKYFEVY